MATLGGSSTAVIPIPLSIFTIKSALRARQMLRPLRTGCAVFSNSELKAGLIVLVFPRRQEDFTPANQTLR